MNKDDNFVLDLTSCQTESMCIYIYVCTQLCIMLHIMLYFLYVCVQYVCVNLIQLNVVYDIHILGV